MATDGVQTKVGLLGAAEYRKGLSDMSRSLTVLNTEMQASQSAFKGNEDSMEALSAKSESLQKIYDKQGEKVAYIAKQLEAAKAEYGENSTQVDNLQIALNRAQTAVNKTGAELEATNGKLDAAKKAEAETGDASQSMAKDMGTAADAVEDEGKAADEAEGQSTKLKDAMSGAGEVASGAMKAGLEAAAAAMAALGAAAVAGLKEILTMGDDTQQAMGQLSAQTGATGKELEELGRTAQAVYNNNFGENIGDVNTALATTRTNTGLMGEKLQEATQYGFLLRDTFGMDFAESSRAAASLMEKFGISSKEAYNLIAVGAQKGANQNGDMLDVISEYAPKYAEMGLSADQMMQTLINGAQNGVFQIDKVGDAVKEFSIRAIDGSDGTKDALKMLGLNAKQVTADIAQGGDTGAAAFQQVVAALQKCEDPIKRNQAAVALFGTQYEDLGQDALPILAGIMNTSATTADALGQINEVKYDNMTSALEGARRSIEAQFQPMAKEISDDVVALLSNVSAAFEGGLQPDELDALLDDVGDLLSNILDKIGAAMPMVSKALSKLVSGAATELPKLASTLLPGAMEMLSGLMDSLAGNAEELGELASDMIAQLVEFLIDNAPKMVDAAGDIVQGLIDGLLNGDSLSRIVTGAIEMIGSLGAALVRNAILLVARAPEIIGQLITGILNTDWLAVGIELVQALADGITGAFTNANALAAAYEEQFGATQEAYDAFKQGLEQADLQLEQSAADAEAKKTLATELLNLYSALEDKDVKTDADLSLMAGYAAQIAELYPSLGQYIDPVTGLFTTNTDAILKNIEAMTQLALVKGYEDNLFSLGKEIAKLNTAIDEGTESLKNQKAALEAMGTYKDNVNALNEALKSGGLTAFNDNLTYIYNTLRDIGGYDNPLNGLVDVLEDGTVVLKEGANEADAYEAAVTQMGVAVANANDAFDTQNSVYNQSKATLESMQTDAEGVNGKIERTAKLINEGTDAYKAMTPAAEDAGGAGKQAGDDVNAGGDAAKEGADKFNEAANSMEGADTTAGDVATGVSEAGAEVLATAEQIAATVADIQGAQTAAEGAQTAVAAVAASISTDAQTALTTVETACASIALYAQAMLDGVQTTLTDGTDAVALAGATLAKAVEGAIKAVLNDAKGRAIGKAYGFGIQSGIAGSTGGVQGAARDLANAACSALNDAVNGGGFYNVGTSIASGVASGIRNGSGEIIEAARAAALAAYNAAKRALDINSPSRLMAGIGENYSLGFAEGITGRMGDVLAAARSLSSMAAADTAGGWAASTARQAEAQEIDYQKMGNEVAAAMVREGIGTVVLAVNGRELGQCIEPDVSRATYQRAGQTAAGRASRLVIR